MKTKTMLFCPLVFALLSCKSVSPKVLEIERDYDDFKDVEITWEKAFSPAKPSYFLYIYSKTCGHCQEIKQDVLSFVAHDYFPTFLINYSDEIPVKRNPEKTIGVIRYEDLYISGTPTLIHIDGGAVFHNIVGTTEILDYISIYK